MPVTYFFVRKLGHSRNPNADVRDALHAGVDPKPPKIAPARAAAMVSVFTHLAR